MKIPHSSTRSASPTPKAKPSSATPAAELARIEKQALNTLAASQAKADQAIAGLEKLVPQAKTELEALKNQIDRRFTVERSALEGKFSEALKTFQALDGSSSAPAAATTVQKAKHGHKAKKPVSHKGHKAHGHTPAKGHKAHGHRPTKGHGHKPVTTPSTGSVGSPWKKGPGTLGGADTSAWQSDADFKKSIAGTKWSAIKATEGTGWTDPTFKSRWNMLGERIKQGKMKLRVAYTFLHPGDGVGQAKHFLSTLGIHGKLQPGTRLCLDWEAAALNSPGTLKAAADYIHQVTGTWPMVYVQGSKLSVAQATVPNAPMWEAAYGRPVNRNVPFFQYSDGPNFDHDVFNGDEKALEKFAGW
jgi:hypothetical protein